ncbi:MAG TPA: Gfo/Idh/MocA family oxidoreductase [Verrucomicrobiales bacterium]|jgi:predicted dehydrogenase|nr:Gfo/Idh/MocA family oxidoreductase [Verrucomicrobiales bacterium]
MQPIHRRRFLLSSAAALGFPSIIPGRVFGDEAPSKKITIGCIGVGDHGTGRNLNMLLQQADARVVAVCDVFKSRRLRAQGMTDKAYGGPGCKEYGDFREILARKDIDAVMISTPDHWHVPISVMALRAGKDVICEKPTGSIEQGRILANLVKERKAVFQTSTEDRSLMYYHRMAEIVRNGRIGKLQSIEIKLPAGNRWPTEQPAPVPADLDYDLWLGPARESPYTPLKTEPMRWRQIFDYSGGLLTDWGAHQVDTAQWANDTERSGPVEVEGEGTVNEGSMYNTFVDYKLRYRYANGVEMKIESGGTSLRFNGTEGWVGNPGWDQPLQASTDEIRRWNPKDGDLKLPTCRGGEHRSFLDSVKSRQDPYCPAEFGHRIATILHMGNIAMKLRRKLKWDPDKEEFVGDPEANALRSIPMRKPWTLA